jgi:hypothetical protein
MRNGPNLEEDRSVQPEQEREQQLPLPRPTASFRRRAWLEFQRALDPLAPVRQLPLRRE